VIDQSQMTLNDYIANVDERRVVARSSFRGDAPWGVFENEYVWFLRFTEDGEKVTEIEEFIDSLTTHRLREQIRRWEAEKDR
jgi:ketosteroid isomerase-like protein